MEWLALGMGLFSMGTSLFGAGNQKSLDREQVDLAYQDNLEKIRRRKFEQGQTLGETQVLTGASGVRHTPGSTAQQYLDAMSKEFQYELDWMRSYAAKARKLGMKSADVRATTNVLNAFSGGVNTGASIYGSGQ